MLHNARFLATCLAKLVKKSIASFKRHVTRCQPSRKAFPSIGVQSVARVLDAAFCNEPGEEDKSV